MEQAAERELEEELGLKAEDIRVISLSNQLRYLKDGVHCVIIGARAKAIGEPKIKDPKKIEEIRWFPFDNLPGEMFEGSEQIVRAIKSGKFYISD
ncbi:MAG: MutT/NUDIX family protein [Microgenomates group bacterium LiPW_31]|nr:MAG: MutT/NUDIX family protein [Microgenomates group bacterium LiPW_31]